MVILLLYLDLKHKVVEVVEHIQIHKVEQLVLVQILLMQVVVEQTGEAVVVVHKLQVPMVHQALVMVVMEHFG